MATGRFRAFEVAVEQAERQRDAARQVLAKQLQAHQQAQLQMEQLQNYAEETSQRWGARENTVMQPEVLRHHYQFLGRLEHAMGLQTRTISEHEVRVRQARDALLTTELRLDSLRKLLQGRRDAWAQQQHRQEQKQTDEFAAQRFARVQASNGAGVR